MPSSLVPFTAASVTRFHAYIDSLSLAIDYTGSSPQSRCFLTSGYSAGRSCTRNPGWSNRSPQNAIGVNGKESKPKTSADIAVVQYHRPPPGRYTDAWTETYPVVMQLKAPRIVEEGARVVFRDQNGAQNVSEDWETVTRQLRKYSYYFGTRHFLLMDDRVGMYFFFTAPDVSNKYDEVHWGPFKRKVYPAATVLRPFPEVYKSFMPDPLPLTPPRNRRMVQVPHDDKDGDDDDGGGSGTGGGGGSQGNRTWRGGSGDAGGKDKDNQDSGRNSKRTVHPNDIITAFVCDHLEIEPTCYIGDLLHHKNWSPWRSLLLHCGKTYTSDTSSADSGCLCDSSSSSSSISSISDDGYEYIHLTISPSLPQPSPQTFRIIKQHTKFVFFALDFNNQHIVLKHYPSRTGLFHLERELLAFHALFDLQGNGIPHCIGLFRAENSLFLATSYIPWTPLSSVPFNPSPLVLDSARIILAEIHARGIAHRDLRNWKNIFVSPGKDGAVIIGFDWSAEVTRDRVTLDRCALEERLRG
ncbi:hypothetical protein K440DRAFT_642719 [Wilcoxina mikolae CBS 423.85]|nr:hypothetical protein K440DRAFT_642719 [Wilcoxina mikolae CBS 423.85]